MTTKTMSVQDHVNSILPVVPGKWVWKDESGSLEFISNNPSAEKDKRKRAKEGAKRVDRVASSIGKAGRGKSQRGNHPKSPHAPIKQTSEHTTVTLDDVKGVALSTTSDGDNMSETFDGIYGTEQFDNFLLHLLKYFHCFFDKIHQEHKINTTTYIEPSLSEKQAYEDACEKLKVAHRLLGQSYCMLVLGLGLEPQHHMACGQSRVSTTLKDRSMYETLYRFCEFFVWIAFRKKEYDNIRKEIGCLLRSDTFNPAIRVKNAPDEKDIKEKKEKEKEEKKLTPAEYRRLHPKRPAIKSIIHQRSPAIVAILPSPKEEASWLFRTRNPLSADELSKIGREDLEEMSDHEEEDSIFIDKKTFKIGIIGEPLAQFNLQTLSPLGSENDDEENEEDGEKVAQKEEGSTEKAGADGWDEDWGSWNEEMTQPEDSEAEESDASVDKNNSWLQQCVTSLSPANDIMAVAYQDKCVLLSQKFQRHGGNKDLETELTVVWQGSFKQEENEIITSLMCLPLASQKRSTQGAPDWTCVIVGFSSGHVRIYTESGTLLLSQLLHTEPVQKLKCRTYEPHRYLGLAEQQEEVVIMYQRAIVTIDGFSLVQSLRACRNQVARATASGSDSFFHPPPLAYKKWGLQDQENISDFCSCGVDTPNPFDNMKHAAMTNSTLRHTPPAAGLYMTSGIGHYVGFFYTTEGSTQPILSEVAYAVAHKLKSAFMSATSGWLGFGNKHKEETKHGPKIEPATPIKMAYGLPDKRRHGITVHLSPSDNYAATTDSFGRVVLVDVQRGIAIRMWKGYRDAQLGWVQVKENSSGGGHGTEQGRVAQFLIIYAPRRGILEVWTAGLGPRVAAFNVSKSSVLICPGYGMMGLNNVTARGINTRAFHCALVDIDGTVKTLYIPFHLALSDKNDKRARDLHLLKTLKAMLKETKEETDDFVMSVKNLIQDMRTANIMQQAVERVLTTKYLSTRGVSEVLTAAMEQVTKRDSLDIDSKLFLKYCELQQSLVTFYSAIGQVKASDGMVQEKSASQILEESLGVTESEALHIATQVEQFQAKKRESEGRGRSVRFVENRVFTVQDFHNCFVCHPHVTKLEAPVGDCVTLKGTLSSERKHGLGDYLFKRYLNEGTEQELEIFSTSNTFSPELLKTLLVEYWLSSDEREVFSVPCLHNLLKVLKSKTGEETWKSWLLTAQGTCRQSHNVLSAYLLALSYSSVAKEDLNREEIEQPDEEESIKNKAETEGRKPHLGTAEVSEDTECWNVLIRQLEDALAVNSLLQLPPTTGDTTKVSVQKILEGGRGSVAEIIGSELARRNITSADLFKTTMLDSTEMMEITGSEESTEDDDESKVRRVRDCLQALQQRFPHSLENDVLLCNCCWENAVSWNKDVQLVEKFESSIEFLMLIQNAVLRHGIASMLWQMFVSERFASLAQLMEKVGKVPKDRLCRKEVGVEETSLGNLAGCMMDLLQALMEANCEVNEVPVFNIEPAWQDVRGPHSLVDLAIETKMTNYSLIRHHFHLAVMMHAIVVFKMKSVKVLSHFDSKGRHAFFCDLTQHPLLPSPNLDDSISYSRSEFLQRVITSAVQTLEEATDSKTPSLLRLHSEGPSTSSPFKRKSNVAVKWPNLVLELAKDFGLDVDIFKRHHVCELYSSGFDKAAEEVLITVNDHEAIGSQLLQIAGKRINHYLLVSHKMEGVELLTNVPPSLSTWIRSLTPTDLRKPESSVQCVAMMLQHVVNNLAEGYPEYDIALGLVDLVQSMSK